MPALKATASPSCEARPSLLRLLNAANPQISGQDGASPSLIKATMHSNTGARLLGRRRSGRGLSPAASGALLPLMISLVWGYPESQHVVRYLDDITQTTTKTHPLAHVGELVHDLEAAVLGTAVTDSPLECFQVAEPVLLPGDYDAEQACTVTLMDHSFANSYGSPFVGSYTPPGCSFDRVVMNFTVEVAGRQYDRWGSMYLGNIEVFSTSTAEPTSTGIRWTWMKDVTPYLSLWNEPQTVIFELDNVVTDIYTGVLNTTLTATFLKSAEGSDGREPADLIVPVSANKSPTTASFWTVPEENATASVLLPRNVNRAVFASNIKAQANDEFWWSNVPESAVNAFSPDVGTYAGYSPWRELQVYIDGRLAGVDWPYPVIFTGGVVPQLHRPIVATEAFDLRDHEIDITPWLPLLCDGNNHTFSMKMVGLVDNGVDSASLSSTVESSWYIVGKIFLWLDEDADSITTGTMDSGAPADPTIDFSMALTQNATGFNQTLSYNLSVRRDLAFTAELSTQKGNGTAAWSQSLSYSNVGGLYDNGVGSITTFATTGLEKAASPGGSYSTSFNFPLYCNTTTSQSAEGNLTLWAVLDQGLNLEVQGDTVYPTGLEAFETGGATWTGSVINTERNSTANYSRYADNTVTTGIGSTDQVYHFAGLGADGAYNTPGTELYYRSVSAYNNSVVADYEVVDGQVTTDWS